MFQSKIPSRWSVVGFLILMLSLPGCALKKGKDSIQVQVCHIPPGNSFKGKVINVGSERELEAHLAHGDVVFGMGLYEDCGGGDLIFRIDDTIEPTVPFAPGYRGGPPRPLGVIADAEGHRIEYSVKEIMVRVTNTDQLNTFLSQYEGRIVRDDTVLIGTEDGGTKEIPGGADGLHIIAFDPSKSTLLDLVENAVAAGITGELILSSVDAARTLALQLREQKLHTSMNIAFFPTVLNEHPDGSGGFIDFADQWWMSNSEVDGPSTGVARALRYLRHTGLPPREGIWTPARVAVLDAGFDLDPETGIGSQDYNNNPFTPPLQIDATSGGGAGGRSGGGWHGQAVFGICCAYPRNGYGNAGTGGDLIRPILIKVGTSIFGLTTIVFSGDAHYGIHAGWLMGADVFNMSFGSDGLLFDLFQLLTGDNLQSAIFTGIVDGGVVVAAAGNGPDLEISNSNFWPCKLDSVICVGAIDEDGQNVFNWGDGVDISAPGVDLLTTVIPDTADDDDDDVGQDELAVFKGTSAAAPFVSGIIGMLKVIDHNDDNITLRWDDIQDILQGTANCAQTPSPCPKEPRDPHVVKGYVDALRAVQSVRANPPPTGRITFLSNGDRKSWAHPILFQTSLRDIPAPWDFVGSIRLTSDPEGEICTAQGDSNMLSCEGRLETLGPHRVTLVATDEWGASSEPDTIEIEVVNGPPVLSLLSPTEGSTRFVGQQVVFRATVRDSDDEDYNFPCPHPGGACVQWESSIDGNITPQDPIAPSFIDFLRTLSLGDHTITVTAIDGKGEMASASTTITILAGSGLPTAHIVNVTTGTGLDGLSTSFLGRGTDPEDGTLPGTVLEWSSDLDGFLGTGQFLQVPLSVNGCGTTVVHTITLKVTDSDGNVDTDTITVTTNVVC